MIIVLLKIAFLNEVFHYFRQCVKRTQFSSFYKLEFQGLKIDCLHV